MNLKFPKKIEIVHMTFKMIYNKKAGGAYFSFGDREIGIGTRDLEKDPDSIFMLICHEVMEAIHCITNTRYMDESVSENYKFFMDHKEFETNMIIFSKTIKQFLKE